MNQNWYSFKERIYGNDYMIWHDGVGDEGRRLAQEDPELVRCMILAGLRKEDYVAVEALRQVDIPNLLPSLREQLQKVHGKFKIELATFLQEKDPEATDDRYAKIVIHELYYPTYVMRMDSAILLRHFPAQYVNDTLLDRVANDPDYYVRYHSADSYLKVNGIKPDEIFAHETIFPLINQALDRDENEEDFKRHAQGAEMLRALKF